MRIRVQEKKDLQNLDVCSMRFQKTYATVGPRLSMSPVRRLWVQSWLAPDTSR